MQWVGKSGRFGRRDEGLDGQPTDRLIGPRLALSAASDNDTALFRLRCLDGGVGNTSGRTAAANDASAGQIERGQFEIHLIARLDRADHRLELAGDMRHQLIPVGQAHAVGGDSQWAQNLGGDMNGIFLGHGGRVGTVWAEAGPGRKQEGEERFLFAFREQCVAGDLSEIRGSGQ